MPNNNSVRVRCPDVDAASDSTRVSTYRAHSVMAKVKRMFCRPGNWWTMVSDHEVRMKRLLWVLALAFVTSAFAQQKPPTSSPPGKNVHLDSGTRMLMAARPLLP
jgi:hypothetical protein